MSRKIFIEGMPGTGKSSILFDIISSDDNYDLIPELHLSDQDSGKKLDKSKLYHQTWKNRMKILDSDIDKTFLFDRTYYSNLAFTYAHDKLKGGSLYNDMKNMIKNDMKTGNYDMMLLFDAEPETTLSRREYSEKEMESPWDNPEFLKHVREFFNEKIEEFAPGAIRINTENESLDSVEEKVNTFVPFDKGKKENKNKNIERLLLNYARRNNMGEQHSPLVSFLDFPAMYFGRDCIIYKNNNVEHLDNNLLYNLFSKQEDSYDKCF